MPDWPPILTRNFKFLTKIWKEFLRYVIAGCPVLISVSNTVVAIGTDSKSLNKNGVKPGNPILSFSVANAY